MSKIQLFRVQGFLITIKYILMLIYQIGQVKTNVLRASTQSPNKCFKVLVSLLHTAQLYNHLFFSF